MLWISRDKILKLPSYSVLYDEARVTFWPQQTKNLAGIQLANLTPLLVNNLYFLLCTDNVEYVLLHVELCSTL